MDWVGLPEDDGKYHRYLASREWALLKNAVRERSGGTCEHCRKAPARQTHHTTYERIYREALDDLLHVCRPCHAFLSGKIHVDPAAPPEPAIGDETIYASDVYLAMGWAFTALFVLYEKLTGGVPPDDEADRAIARNEAIFEQISGTVGEDAQDEIRRLYAGIRDALIDHARMKASDPDSPFFVSHDCEGADDMARADKVIAKIRRTMTTSIFDGDDIVELDRPRGAFSVRRVEGTIVIEEDPTLEWTLNGNEESPKLTARDVEVIRKDDGGAYNDALHLQIFSTDEKLEELLEMWRRWAGTEFFKDRPRVDDLLETIECQQDEIKRLKAIIEKGCEPEDVRTDRLRLQALAGLGRKMSELEVCRVESSPDS